MTLTFDNTLACVHMEAVLKATVPHNDANPGRDDKNYLANKGTPTEIETYVRDEVLGGEARILALKSALQFATKEGWQLWIMSNGVKAELIERLTRWICTNTSCRKMAQKIV